MQENVIYVLMKYYDSMFWYQCNYFNNDFSKMSINFSKIILITVFTVALFSFFDFNHDHIIRVSLSFTAAKGYESA